MTNLIAGLVLGLASSAHCAAMCGPLVLLSGARGEGLGRWPAWRRAAAYHAGRATVYVAIGLIAGVAGDAVAGAGFGRTLAVAAGVMLLLHVVGVWPAGPAAVVGRALAGLTMRVSRAARRWHVDTPMVHGVLHGLLPCGVLYLAAAAAAGLGNVAHAAAFMGGFAIGTTPILAAVSLVAPVIGHRLPPMVKRAAPVAVALVGVLLVARGIGVLPAGHDSHGSHGAVVSGADDHDAHAAHQPHMP
ncbi:MAG TPA: sulfite exporter TauE/SafE family protein [Luteitalea sp.]|nr:sulfite exporter TauE/SafE family protein [Luteitalea sp.]